MKRAIQFALLVGLSGCLVLFSPVTAQAQAQAKTQAEAPNILRFSSQSNLNGLDPYTLNETFTLSMLGSVYEGLIRRGKDMEIEPALAQSWEVIDPLRWRFHLRQGVTFHNGNALTAEDVAFSFDRARSRFSNLNVKIPAGLKVEIIDDYTVDFVLETPNPILLSDWEPLFIMDKDWTLEHGAGEVGTPADRASYASFHANGTGPFKILSHQPGVLTVFARNDTWWDEPEHNLDLVEFRPISSAPTRVGALLSGAVDLIDPVPVQDIPRIERAAGLSVLSGPDIRTIFLGFDQMRPELLHSDVEGQNPFQDRRVRKAFYQAIDTEAIAAQIMRGMAQPSATMISPELFSGAHTLSRYPYDPDAARALMADAGYPDGFSLAMDCPNDRYVNDERICLAIANMLARIGVRVAVNAQTRALLFEKIGPRGGYNTSFFLFGWSPSSLDGWSVLSNLMNCRDEAGIGSPFNHGGMCDAEIDLLTENILTELDRERRDDLILRAFFRIHDEVYYIPLHQQALAWGVSDKLDVVQRPDNALPFRFVKKH